MLKTIYATTIVFLIFFLQACSPVYKTNYIYHPVQSEKGRACANECIKNKQSCHRECLDLQRQCERDANMLGLASELVKIQAEDATYHSTRTSLIAECQQHLDKCELACDQHHKLCHENCGGEVTIQSLCVKNCK
jgi:hypothetical protein